MRRIIFTILALLATLPALAYQVMTPKGVMDAGYSNSEGLKASYSAVAPDIAPAATATDIVVLKASATKTIRVTLITVSGDATLDNTIDLYVYKRTTANTGGTTAAITPVAHDSNDAATTATVVKYTANAATLGTGNLIRAGHYALPASAGPKVPVVALAWEFGTRNAKTFVLKAGSNESIAVSMAGGAVPTGTQLYVNIEWTEE